MRKRTIDIFIFLILSFVLVKVTIFNRNHLVYRKEIVIAKTNFEIITLTRFKNLLKAKDIPEYILYDYSKSRKMLNTILQELVLLKEARQYLPLDTTNTSLLLNELKGSIMKGFIPAIAEQDIQTYYNLNRQFFYRKLQYRIAHILVDNSKKLQLLTNSLNALLAKSRSPQEAMITLINNLSQNNSSPKEWGDLGWVSKERFPKEIGQKIFALRNSGEYTTFSSPLGYHFVMVMHVREPKSYSFDEVSSYIKSKLEEESKKKFWDDYIHKLKQKYNVRIYSHNLKKAIPREKREGMVFIKEGKFYVGYNRKEIKERYEIWEKYVKPFVNQGRPGWADYIYQTYRKTKVKSFYVDKYEVTYKDYKQFLEATEHQPLPEWVEKFIPGEDYPIVGVTWHDAEAYCKWRGKRLPIQDEWEFAARGDERRMYPWGNDNPDGTRGNFADINADVPWRNISYNDGYKFLAPIGSYPQGATPDGIYDLGGNVKEWTATVDWKKKVAITKGGSFKNAFDDMQGADQRPANIDTVNHDIGFRCACNLKDD